jgi:ABC-2 type transport system ATP-binding protein
MNDIEALTDRIVLIGKGRVLYDGALSALRMKFDRIKTLTLTFSNLSSAPQANGCQCLSFTPTRAVYQIDTQRISVPQAMGTLFAGADVLDVQVESQPVEEIVARIYREYAL